MLPFRFESNGAEILFYYDVTHCEAMHGVLRSVVPGGQYVGMLVGSARTLAHFGLRPSLWR